MTIVVCWTARFDKPDREGNIGRQRFMIYSESDKSKAVELYDQLSINKSVTELYFCNTTATESHSKNPE